MPNSKLNSSKLLMLVHNIGLLGLLKITHIQLLAAPTTDISGFYIVNQ